MNDVLIVTPPFSPHDTSPPLGPAVLTAQLTAAGLTARQVDLNIRFLLQFDGADPGSLVGDHAKDRLRVEQARRAFQGLLHLPRLPCALVPDSVDPILGLPHGFDDLDRALAAMAADSMWSQFLDRHLFGDNPPPKVLGISVMGPAQVLPAMLVAMFSKRLWPNAVVTVGGSHVTLLANEIARDPRYAMGVVDAFLPHHSERAFASMCLSAGRGGPWRAVPGVTVAGSGCAPGAPEGGSWMPPVFEMADLSLYGPAISIPLQLGRGCAYGRCTFCTYPAVELRGARIAPTGMADHLAAATATGCRSLSVKDSLMPLKTMLRFGKLVTELAPHLVWSATTKLTRGVGKEAGRLAAGGCTTLEFGVETIHPRLQALIDKTESVKVVEYVVNACAKAGIAVVLNLLYGLPGETWGEARYQLRWFENLAATHPGLVHGSHNLVEVNRQAPFAQNASRFGIELGHVGPWAFSYRWNAPGWRATFQSELEERVAALRSISLEEAA